MLYYRHTALFCNTKAQVSYRMLSAVRYTRILYSYGTSKLKLSFDMPVMSGSVTSSSMRSTPVVESSGSPASMLLHQWSSSPARSRSCLSYQSQQNQRMRNLLHKGQLRQLRHQIRVAQ